MKSINIKTKTRLKGIKVGANTVHQDQDIWPVNFNPINKIVSNPKNPIPPLLELLLLLTFLPPKFI